MSGYALRSPASRERERKLKQLRVLNRGGRPTGRENWPWVPSALIVRLLEPLTAELEWSAIAFRAGMTERALYDIRTGRRKRVGFDTADRIICFVLGAPELWHQLPELRAIYEQREEEQ